MQSRAFPLHRQTDSRRNDDIQEIMDATPTEHDIVWIGPDQETPFGTGSRFDGYQYFNHHPEALLDFLAQYTG